MLQGFLQRFVRQVKENGYIKTQNPQSFQMTLQLSPERKAPRSNSIKYVGGKA